MDLKLVFNFHARCYIISCIGEATHTTDKIKNR
jgi:hypothetical protein